MEIMTREQLEAMDMGALEVIDIEVLKVIDEDYDEEVVAYSELINAVIMSKMSAEGLLR